MKIIWTFTLLMIPGVVTSISVTGYSGGGVIITCRYDRKYTANAKYFCKGEWSKSTDQIKTYNKNKWVHSGRFSLYDDTRAAVFTVTIRDLSEQDSDIYYCGTDIYAKMDSYTEVNLNIITGVVSSISVTGYSGGGVIITCRYDRKYTANAKYFCKGQKPKIPQTKWCSDLIRTEEKEKWVYDKRFFLYDDTSAAVFTVTIRDLSEQDSGTYQCASDISWIGDSYNEVNLNVLTVKDDEVPFFTRMMKNIKLDGRFTIHNGSSAGFLRLFIKELNVNDSGEYKIMVKVSEDHRFFSKLNLNIEDADCCEKSLSAAAGGSVNISCKYPQSHSADVKFVCRRSGSDLCAEETSLKKNRRWSAEGQIQLYDDREQQLLMGTISHVTQQHSAEYWCGVQSDQGHKSFITRVLINVTGVVSSISVTGYSGREIIITCKYDREYSANEKYFCKGQWSTICSDLIKTEEKNKAAHSGRFSLYDDTSAAVFTVTIRDLSEHDSGTYQCGVDKSGQTDSYTEVNLNVITGVVSSISVTGYSGGGVRIKCAYDEGYTAYIKYFCRGEWSVCPDQIKTEEKDKWVHSGRFSLYDDTRAAVFTVIIRDLSKQDSDIYYCGTERTGYDLYTEVNLKVSTADCCEKSISLSAAAGGSVNISCKYPQSRSADVKFVCKRSGSDLCAEETSVKENRRWSAEGQIQLYDDREQQLLTGTISHVTQQHSAEYWCGVQSDQGHKSFITQVLINVTGTDVFFLAFFPLILIMT
ncbi:polymeric immunoglobulin receptor-like protein [Labeo rohita]|nr:polymeric immunoglobulin receptor-like protein [Labeo rohita]